MQAARAVEKAFAAARKSLPINVDGAIGAILADLGMDPAAFNGIFMIARARPDWSRMSSKNRSARNRCAASIQSITATTGHPPEAFPTSPHSKFFAPNLAGVKNGKHTRPQSVISSGSQVLCAEPILPCKDVKKNY